MILFIKGTPAEIDEFLYGDCEEINRIAEEDNPNIPIGDDSEDNPACACGTEARATDTNSILDYLKGAKVIIANGANEDTPVKNNADEIEYILDKLMKALK